MSGATDPPLPQPDLLAAIPRLRRYARVLTGDVNRADDLVQDTLARAWEKRRLWAAVQFAQVRDGWFLERFAKFPRAPVKPPNQAVTLLGLNFFDENGAGVRCRYRRTGNTGWIDLP